MVVTVILFIWGSVDVLSLSLIWATCALYGDRMAMSSCLTRPTVTSWPQISTCIRTDSNIPGGSCKYINSCTLWGTCKYSTYCRFYAQFFFWCKWHMLFDSFHILSLTYSFLNLFKVGFWVLVPPCSWNNQTDLDTSYIYKQNVFALSRSLSFDVQHAGPFIRFSFQPTQIVCLWWEFADLFMLKKESHIKYMYVSVYVKHVCVCLVPFCTACRAVELYPCIVQTESVSCPVFAHAHSSRSDATACDPPTTQPAKRVYKIVWKGTENPHRGFWKNVWKSKVREM